MLSSDQYSAYGALLSGGGSGDPFGCGGQYGYYTDSATGLVLCGMRYYDPGTGRWISRDPIGYGGELNLYRYCMGNPVMGVDPSGTDDIDDPDDMKKELEKQKLHGYKPSDGIGICGLPGGGEGGGSGGEFDPIHGDQPGTMYHYTHTPGAFCDGMSAGLSFTDNGNLTQSEAADGLGINPPTDVVVVPPSPGLSFIPVGETGSGGYGGGGEKEFIGPAIPPGSLTIRPVPIYYDGEDGIPIPVYQE